MSMLKNQFEVEAENVNLVLDRSIPCGLLLNELITNSLKYAFPEGRKGRMWIKFIPEDETMAIEFGDNGVGIPENINLAPPKSLGLQLVQMLATHDLHGSITLERDQGTQFHIEFPVNEDGGAT